MRGLWQAFQAQSIFRESVLKWIVGSVQWKVKTTTEHYLLIYTHYQLPTINYPLFLCPPLT